MTSAPVPDVERKDGELPAPVDPDFIRITDGQVFLNKTEALKQIKVLLDEAEALTDEWRRSRNWRRSVSSSQVASIASIKQRSERIEKILQHAITVCERNKGIDSNGFMHYELRAVLGEAEIPLAHLWVERMSQVALCAVSDS